MTLSVFYGMARSPSQFDVETKGDSQRLRGALTERFSRNRDSTLGDEWILRQSDGEWLSGLRDAGVDGAGELIEALMSGRVVRIWIGVSHQGKFDITPRQLLELYRRGENITLLLR